tara:strand:+ start:174 stop:401 length:228 start_codon:yes stop_codon:yes gene_type:complete
MLKEMILFNNPECYAMSEWLDMQKKPNTKLQHLIQKNKFKSRKISELSKIKQNRLAKLNIMLDRLRRRKTCEIDN